MTQISTQQQNQHLFNANPSEMTLHLIRQIARAYKATKIGNEYRICCLN